MKLFDENLGPKKLGAISASPELDMAAAEKILGFRMPSELRKLLIETKAAIVFEKGAKFKPSEETGLEDSDGFLGLEVLYGIGNDISGLIKRNSIYKDQLPSRLVTIGESSGGDQICLEKKTGKIFYWHHEAQAEEESTFEVANTFVEFLKSLSPDNLDSKGAKGVVKGKSSLDF